MAGKDTPPPVPLNISAEAQSVNALINTVIIFGGPGSWKRDAYWDEYMMSITNNGEHPVILTSATLPVSGAAHHHPTGSRNSRKSVFPYHPRPATSVAAVYWC